MAGVEQRLGGSSPGCCLLSFAPLARTGEEKGIIKPKHSGNFFLEHEDAGREALIPAIVGWTICQTLSVSPPTLCPLSAGVSSQGLDLTSPPADPGTMS